LEALAASLALTRTTQFINVLDVSYLNQRDSQSPAAQGYELEFQIPLFDWGNAKRARSEQMYKEAVYRVAQQVIQARSEMRVAYHQYRAAYDVANYYQKERIPLQKQISNEKLLRYNGMLLSVFDLLEDAREQMLVVVAAIEAKRDFWLADTQLDISLSAYSAEGVSAPSILSEGDVRGK
jgi:outer membrane protein TolC